MGMWDDINEQTSLAASSSFASNMKNLGLLTSIMGGINSAIGSYYQAKTLQYQAKSEAQNYRFQSDMAALNARAAEFDAQSVLNAGQGEVARYTMEAGQRKAGVKTAIASRGLVLGEGSTRDIEASMDVVKDIDVLTINANAVREAEARRMRGQNYRNQALLYGVSSQNSRRTANSISPGLALGSSLLSSATSLASQWNWQRD